MLILSRRVNEVIRISGLIRIRVIGFKGNQVRLGIDAPPEVVVDREEIYLRKQEELRATLARTEAHESPPLEFRAPTPAQLAPLIDPHDERER